MSTADASVAKRSMSCASGTPGAIDAGSAEAIAGNVGFVESANVQVPVSFDIGELQVGVRELEQLQPGHVFELAQDVADATVSVRVGGGLIAVGRLVAVGRKIGVRVSQVMMDRAMGK